MEDSACNFYINKNFNPGYDLTWSFQYSVSGTLSSTGGFSTFLFEDNYNTGLSGGGAYTGYGYTSYGTTSGVSNAVLGILFDSNNQIKILKGSTFTTLSTLCSFQPLLNQNNEFTTIRFNLTDVGETLKISIKDKITNTYKIISTFDVGLRVRNDDFYKIGFSYASPLTAGQNKLIFKIKNIHIQGNENAPNIYYSNRPIVSETNYLLQSPLCGKIAIGSPTPLSSGYLLYK